jgi:osmotically-inducible protein OsmY
MENSAMKQLNKVASAVFLALTLATIMGCAATGNKESTGEYVDDTAITTKVKAAIFDRPTLKMMDIHVETMKGVVHLWGVVTSRSAVDEAGKVAGSVSGVKSVKNDMRVM